MLTYVLSLVFNKPLSVFATIVFVAYVLLQFLILRKDFKPLYLLELIFTFAFGYFVDVATKILGNWVPGSYPEQLFQLFLSIVFTGLGVACYINTDLVPMPPEAFLLAIMAKKPKWSMGKLRIIHDVAIVIVSVIISLIVLGGIRGFREGTVITAILSGISIDLFNKLLSKPIRKICFGQDK